LKWYFGPIICYLLLPLYVATMSTIYGYAWISDNSGMLEEYLVIVACYYTLCLLGPTFKAILKAVGYKIKTVYKYACKR
jgi:hypothetical protein